MLLQQASTIHITS